MNGIVTLTETGNKKVNDFLKECEALKKELLDGCKDTADKTHMLTIDDIRADFYNIVNEDENDSDNEYYSFWGITDHHGLNLSLIKDVDFIM